MQIRLLITPILFILPVILNGQPKAWLNHILDYYAKVPKECIYLQTDRPYYAAGDTVWFRAHLLDAATRVPVSRSRFVYVELYDQQTNTLMQRIMVKSDIDGVFANSMILPEQTKTGTYMLVAYTQWMRNFQTERFCYKPLTLVGKKQKPDEHIASLQLMRLSHSGMSSDHHDSLQVGQRRGKLLIKYDCEEGYDSLTCIIYGNGNVLEVGYERGKTLSVDCTKFKPGMTIVAMVNSQSGNVIAESYIDIKNEHEALVGILPSVRQKNSPVTLSLSVKDKTGQPLSGTYALSVTDCDVIKPDTSQFAITHTLTEMTSLYNLSDMLTGKYPVTKYPFQAIQTIQGRVSCTMLSSKGSLKLHMADFGTGRQYEYDLGDSCRFSIEKDFVDGTIFQIEATRKSGGKSFIELHIDSLSFPILKMPELKTCDTLSASVVSAIRNESSQSDYDGIMLPDIEKVGHRRPLAKDKEIPTIQLLSGHPKLEIIKDMQTLLHSIGVKRVKTFDGSTKLSVRVFVKSQDGRFIPERLEDIRPSEIEQIDFYRRRKPLPDLVFIMLKAGQQHRFHETPNMATVRQLGYEPPVEFYSPQYPAADKSQYTQPDHRITLYWNPKVRIDEKGETAVTFYASDVSKRYLVTIEGVSDDGIVVSKQVVIE